MDLEGYMGSVTHDLDSTAVERLTRLYPDFSYIYILDMRLTTSAVRTHLLISPTQSTSDRKASSPSVDNPRALWDPSSFKR